MRFILGIFSYIQSFTKNHRIGTVCISIPNTFFEWQKFLGVNNSVLKLPAITYTNIKAKLSPSSMTNVKSSQIALKIYDVNSDIEIDEQIFAIMFKNSSCFKMMKFNASCVYCI